MAVQLAQGKHGRFLVLDNDYWIGRLLIRDGEYSEGEVELFDNLISKDDVVVEAGANIGAHTVPLSKIAGRVVAFEPQQFIYRLLCGNLALNSCNNVDAYPAALGAEHGTELYLPKLDYTSLFNFGGVPLRKSWEGTGDKSGRKFECGERAPVFALDQLHLPSVKLIKADVEGMECDVINGAKETIKRCRPYLYLEDEDEGNDKLYDIVKSLGYRITMHHPQLVGPNDEYNQHPGCVIASKNILCVPNE